MWNKSGVDVKTVMKVCCRCRGNKKPNLCVRVTKFVTSFVDDLFHVVCVDKTSPHGKNTLSVCDNIKKTLKVKLF